MDKVLFFDIFGTLLYRGEPQNHYKIFSEKTKINHKSMKNLLLTFNGDLEVLSSIIGTQHIQLDYINKLLKKEIESITVYKETYKVLQQLRDKEYKIWCISNIAYPYYKKTVDLLVDYVDGFTFSCFFGKAKPDITIFEAAHQEVGFIYKKENITMIGDSYNSDIKGALNYGINAVFLNRTSKNENAIYINNLSNLLSFF